jgi:hypothetical protein
MMARQAAATDTGARRAGALPERCGARISTEA